jgi:hypothetical protein
MKRARLVLTVSLAFLIVSSVSAYLGFRAGQTRSLGLQKGTLVGTLDALERIRSGDTEGGIRRIESLCFMSAEILMADSHYRSNFTVRTFTPKLISYRRAYRTNQNDWSPMEQQLEIFLSQK